MTIEELFGTLQQSVVSAWRKHLRTAKYSKHMALNDFYEEMPDKVDALIEAWMGVNGRKIKSYDNILQSKNMNTLSYLKELRRVVKQGYALMNGEAELEAKLDDIVELIDSTLYKVKELSENKNMKNLKDFVAESLSINESASPNKVQKLLQDMYDSDGDAVSVASCWNWLEDMDWEQKDAMGYAEYVADVSDGDIDVEYAVDMYSDCMVAMAELGRDKVYKIISKIVDKDELDSYDIKK